MACGINNTSSDWQCSHVVHRSPKLCFFKQSLSVSGKGRSDAEVATHEVKLHAIEDFAREIGQDEEASQIGFNQDEGST